MAVIALTCQELVEIVTDYLEHRLSSQDRRRFEQHLAACEACSAYLDQMRETIRLLGRLSEYSIPTPARERRLRAFQGWSSA